MRAAIRRSRRRSARGGAGARRARRADEIDGAVAAADVAALDGRGGIEEASDVALFRELRADAEPTGGAPLHLTRGDAVFAVGVADVLPYELPLHEDRPYPF